MTAHCTELTTDSKVKVQDPQSASAVFLNTGRAEFRKVRVDGCLVQAQQAADWFVSKLGVGSVIVELKGRNVEKAVDQVISTVGIVFAQNLVKKNEKIGALIVCNHVPRCTTKIQRAKVTLKEKHNVRLTVASSFQEFEIERLVGH